MNFLSNKNGFLGIDNQFNIKEKAITKLKEITGKPDELCFKTKQYLEGLIKIPFGSYKHEPILKVMDDINSLFHKLTSNIHPLSNWNISNFLHVSKLLIQCGGIPLIANLVTFGKNIILTFGLYCNSWW